MKWGVDQRTATTPEHRLGIITLSCRGLASWARQALRARVLPDKMILACSTECFRGPMFRKIFPLLFFAARSTIVVEVFWDRFAHEA